MFNVYQNLNKISHKKNGTHTLLFMYFRSVLFQHEIFSPNSLEIIYFAIDAHHHK